MYWNTESALTTESLDGYLRLGRDKVLKNPCAFVLNLGQISQGADPGQGHNWSKRGPSPKEFFFRVKMLQQQTEYIAMIYKHLGRSVDIFGSILTFTFWHVLVSCSGLSHFHCLPFKYFYGAKCLIYINLFTFHVNENSARLQRYSRARYKAPGPLVSILICFCKTFLCSMKVDRSIYI